MLNTVNAFGEQRCQRMGHATNPWRGPLDPCVEKSIIEIAMFLVARLDLSRCGTNQTCGLIKEVVSSDCPECIVVST
jgi:hypothetical protein